MTVGRPSGGWFTVDTDSTAPYSSTGPPPREPHPAHGCARRGGPLGDLRPRAGDRRRSRHRESDHRHHLAGRGRHVYGPTTVTATRTTTGASPRSSSSWTATVSTTTQRAVQLQLERHDVGAHTLQAVAQDAAGNTGSPAVVHVTVPMDTQAPDAPTGLVATTSRRRRSTSPGTRRATIAGSRATGWSGTGSVLPGTLTVRSFTDTGLTPGTRTHTSCARWTQPATSAGTATPPPSRRWPNPARCTPRRGRGPTVSRGRPVDDRPAQWVRRHQSTRGGSRSTTWPTPSPVRRSPACRPADADLLTSYRLTRRPRART